MATWPSTLPIPSFNGYGLQSGDDTIRTDMESGAARVRRRSTSSPDELTLRFVLSASQMATFRDFWDDEWMSGAAWILLPIKDGRSALEANKECRPKPASFKATPLSAMSWALELTVETRHA